MRNPNFQLSFDDSDTFYLDLKESGYPQILYLKNQ